ncbi:hypothetical protein [Ferruginibacter profundus]
MKKSLLFACFVFLLLNAFAQTKTWNGPSGGLWSAGANWLPVGVPGVTDTVIFNSANSCDLDVSPSIASLRTLGIGGNIITSSGAKSMTINNNGAASPVLSVASGSFLSLGNGGGIFFTTYGAGGTNNAQVAGTLSLGAFSTWEINNGAQSNLTNVDISGTVNVVFNHGGAVFNNSTIATTRFLSGSNLNWTTGNAGTIPAADYQNGSTINVTGVTSTMPVLSNAANYNGLLIWNCTGQTISGSSAVLLPTASYSMDSIRVLATGTGTLRIATEPAGYTLGHVEVQGGTLELSAPTIGLCFGTITNELKISAGTVYGNATYSGDIGNAFPTTILLNGKLTMTGGTFDMTSRPLSTGGAFQILINGDVTQTGGTVTATTAFGAQNQFVINGSSAQNLTMSTFSGPISFVINNTSAAGVTLLSTFTIPASPAALIFASGVLRTTISNLLVLSSGSQILGASNASFVDGPVRKFGNTAFVFPVGKSNGTFTAYVPIEISATAGTATDNFTAEYKRNSAQAAYPVANAGINHVSQVDYWVLDRAGSVAPVNVSLYWTATSSNGGSPNYINNLSELIIAYSNGANWVSFSGLGQTTGTTTAGTITWTSLTNTFGPFSLASTTINNPLPINLNYLNGTKQGSSHYLNWKVTCTNNPTATMILERSANNGNYTAITTITADAVRCQQPFDYTDNQPLAGMNYYRLKMIDANGKITYSTIIALLNKESGFDIVGLLPTVVNNNAILNVTAAQKTKMEVVITDIAGRQVQKIAYNLIAGSNQFTLNLGNLGAGTYQLNGYTAEGVSRTIRFVKQ